MYIILYRYRHPIGKREIRAHVLTFDDFAEADRVCAEVALQFKCEAWLMECNVPHFRDDKVKPDLKLLNGGIDGGTDECGAS